MPARPTDQPDRVRAHGTVLRRRNGRGKSRTARVRGPSPTVRVPFGGAARALYGIYFS